MLRVLCIVSCWVVRLAESLSGKCCVSVLREELHGVAVTGRRLCRTRSRASL